MRQDGAEIGAEIEWPRGDNTRVPYQVFMDERVHAREQARIFQGPS